MERAVITVKGQVQKVGYRDVVQKIARKSGVKGYVENLPDGDVRIIAEADKKTLDAFVKQTKIKEGFIEVEEVSVEYKRAAGKFKNFTIKYGKVQEELGDRMGAAIIYLGATNAKIDSGNKMLGEKIDSGNKMLGEKIDSGNKILGDKIDSGDKMLGKKMDNIGSKIESFHHDTARRFDTLDEKYGLISENMERLMEKIDRSAEQTEKTLKVLVEQQRDFNTSVKGLTGAILKLAEKKT